MQLMIEGWARECGELSQDLHMPPETDAGIRLPAGELPAQEALEGCGQGEQNLPSHVHARCFLSVGGRHNPF